MEDMQRVFAVRAYARTKNDGGWDLLREFWSNEDIARATRGASTSEECVARLTKSLRIIDNICEAIRNTPAQGDENSA
jgi:hypothetical protein